MSKIYGYCRISRKEQSIERQERNILAAYPEAIIRKEAFTGTKIEGRKELEKLLKTVEPGDTIVFDSVSRMSRNANDGWMLYTRLFNQGVKLVFLKEPHINTALFAKRIQQADLTTGKQYLDEGLKVILLGIAEEQVQLAFQQAEKEVQDLRQRTREGLVTAYLAGKQKGQQPGRKLNVKKAAAAKEVIRKHSVDFGGTLRDPDCMTLAQVSRNSFYKYKREILAELRA